MASAVNANPGLSGRSRDGLLALLLLLTTFLAYQPAWNGQPIWDDEAHLTQPAFRSADGFTRIWLEPGATQQYYPLVHSAFWLEQKLWGDRTLGYHMVNILLHAFSALLVTAILRQLAIPGAWLAAAIFALHPIEVESVAWISELKNTLSGFFYLASIAIYLRFDRERKWIFYALALGFFALGLLSKTVIATMPAALLVIFWWKRARLSWKRDIAPLLPFFILGITAGLFTAWVECHFIGAEGEAYALTLAERLVLAGRVFWFYLAKLLWPANLIFIYPRWEIDQAAWQGYLFPLAGLALLAAAWCVRKRSRASLAALLYFGGTLFPVLGFFNVYPFRYSYVADHFQYLAGLGVIVLVSTGIVMLLEKSGFGSRPVALALCLALPAALAVLTWRQCRMYTDAETLWRVTLARNQDCWMAHNNLGNLLLKDGFVADAALHFRRALALDPEDADTCKILNNLGNTFQQAGDTDEAIIQYRGALETLPGNAEAHNNLANTLLRIGRMDEAFTHYEKALESEPSFAAAHYNFAVALSGTGRTQEAILHYQAAIEILPDLSEAHNNLANALLRIGRVKEAIAHYEKALEADPQLLQALNNLAWTLATCNDASLRDGPRALELARRAAELPGGGDLMVESTLAAACAESGQFDDAIRVTQQSIESARAAGRDDLAAPLQERLRLYQASQPLREQPR